MHTLFIFLSAACWTYVFCDIVHFSYRLWKTKINYAELEAAASRLEARDKLS
jgi:hypothetical protein